MGRGGVAASFLADRRHQVSFVSSIHGRPILGASFEMATQVSSKRKVAVKCRHFSQINTLTTPFRLDEPFELSQEFVHVDFPVEQWESRTDLVCHRCLLEQSLLVLHLPY
jgi:hypothetical protein